MREGRERRRPARLGFVIVLLSWMLRADPAGATFIGQDVVLESRYPSRSSPPSQTLGPDTVVDPGVEFPAVGTAFPSGNPVWSADVADTTIVLNHLNEFNNAGCGSGTDPFGGFVFTFTLPPLTFIGSVTLNASSTLTPFALSATCNQVFVDYQCLGILPNNVSTIVDATVVSGECCGNGLIAAGEQCDPPGSIACPSADPGGAFLACNPDCTCPAPQTIRGKLLKFKEGSTGEPSRRVTIVGFEMDTDIAIVGDPRVGGATLRVVANGAIGSDETYILDPAGWVALPTGFAYYGPTGSDGDPVGVVKIRRLTSGTALFLARLRGNLGTQPLNVVPPNSGDDGGAILTIVGGDAYCVLFGGIAGGTETTDNANRWRIFRPDGQGCPLP